MSLLAVGVLACGGAGPAPAPAPNPSVPATRIQPAALPLDLATVLMSVMGGMQTPRTQYYVDSLPPGWPPILILPGAKIAGGVAGANRLIGIFTDTTRRPLASFLDVLDSTGWTPMHSAETGGFSSSGGSRANQYCRGSTGVFASSSLAPSGRTYVAASYTPADPFCNGRQIRAQQGLPLEFPKLAPPPGITAFGGGGGEGSDQRETRASLQTTLPPSVILAHYTSQLVAAGWTSQPAAVTPAAAVQGFEARDKSGKLWRGSLIISVSGEMRDLRLEMRRVSGQ